MELSELFYLCLYDELRGIQHGINDYYQGSARKTASHLSMKQPLPPKRWAIFGIPRIIKPAHIATVSKLSTPRLPTYNPATRCQRKYRQRSLNARNITLLQNNMVNKWNILQ